MKTTTFLKQALLLGVVACSSALWGQGGLSNPIFAEDFGILADATPLTTSNTAFSYIRVGTTTSGTPPNEIIAKNPSSFTNSSGLIGAKGGSISTVDKTGFTSFSSGTLTLKFKTPSSLTSAVMVSGVGTGSSFGSANGFTGSQLSAAFQISGGNLQIRSSSNWTTVQAVTASTSYTVTIVFNNTAGSLSYNGNTLPSNKVDIWVNGVKASTQYSAATSSLAAAAFRVYTTTAEFEVDDIAVYNTLPTAPTWDGTQWVGGTPSASTDAVINGDYSGSSFTAANLTVNATKTLTITNGNTVTVTNVTNNGSVIVENGGNFIQATGGTYANSGNFTVNKNTTSAINKYVFWASPTVSQNMFGIHTTTPQYVMTYNSDTDYYNTLANPATSVSGVGYSVKMPVASAIATFGGTSAQPNNGDVTVTLNNTSTNKYNLIGNPYPSNLNLNTFYNNGSNNVGSTFWFWDNTSNNVTTQTGNTTTNVGYATYNAAGSGTWTEAPSSSVSHSGNAAAIGQGFIVEATGATATFTNAMRVSTSGNTFNKLNGNDTGKFWLKLATPYGSHTTLAVNYEGGALNGYDQYDSNAMGVGSDAFYSTIGAEKLVIQGKSPFTVDDVVPLGNKHFEAGSFVISLTQKEGLFNNGQAIYLHDKDLGTYTNLQNGNYSFSANAGEFTNRFEIVYKLGVLATQEIEKTTFEVYRDGEGFVARNNKNIDVLEIFDASGRKVVELKPNVNSIKFKLDTKGMYILKAISAGKEYTKKLIK